MPWSPSYSMGSWGTRLSSPSNLRRSPKHQGTSPLLWASNSRLRPLMWYCPSPSLGWNSSNHSDQGSSVENLSARASFYLPRHRTSDSDHQRTRILLCYKQLFNLMQIKLRWWTSLLIWPEINSLSLALKLEYEKATGGNSTSKGGRRWEDPWPRMMSLSVKLMEALEGSILMSLQMISEYHQNAP